MAECDLRSSLSVARGVWIVASRRQNSLSPSQSRVQLCRPAGAGMCALRWGPFSAAWRGTWPSSRWMASSQACWNAAVDGGAGASPSVYIVNTGMSSSVGQDNHWFTVALEF